MTETAIYHWALFGWVSMFVGFFVMIFCITAVFPKVKEVEKIVATPGKQLDGVRWLWGGGPIGRWMRCTHIALFFILAKVPGFGQVWRSRLGDEPEPVPLRLKLWILIPFGIFNAAAAGFAGVGVLLEFV